ncbi:Pop3p Ecym_3599 [Eremothecium cymbalariae DBVPG|uniref:Uncharacterized protein n=1 Tax=Eremothecium cymbalariae (strain CBS 270.75 / DBVPG 7215 / KCTC 17166 / NRRL Y-17582) TaxID=931890 RepID=G8JQT0_ERECY|nr:Hypothetical protein Ecym_3599 [Eremothecium cymbalariae DBVPG\
MESIKKAERRIAKKKQVYKAILDNAYANDGQLWPLVDEQGLVVELLDKTILRPLKHSSHLGASEKPVQVVTGYNEVMEFLTGACADEGLKEVFLFVCNKDLAGVLVEQIPIAAYMSRYDVCLVQLPKGSLARFTECLEGIAHDGLLLVPVVKDGLDKTFTSKIRDCVPAQEIPWLQSARYKRAPVKMLRTVIPIGKQKQK